MSTPEPPPPRVLFMSLQDRAEAEDAVALSVRSSLAKSYGRVPRADVLHALLRVGRELLEAEERTAPLNDEELRTVGLGVANLVLTFNRVALDAKKKQEAGLR